MVCSLNKYLISISIILLLVGCETSRKIYRSTSSPSPAVDVSKIPDATPRHEPKSRYGNPKSYEVFGRRYFVMNSAKGFVESGIASWYGPNFHGKKTSSQETYDMNKMTAAHKTIPIPSYVEVTNLQNGRRIIVRVNDRGPFHDNRIIDLSYVAASKLDIVKAGTGMVEIRVIDPSNPQAHRIRSDQKRPDQKTIVSKHKATVKQETGQKKFPTSDQKRLFIQLGAFSDLGNAQNFRTRIQNTLKSSTHRIVSIATFPGQNGILYRVRIGPVADIEAADQVVHDLNAAGLYDHHVLFQ